MKLIQKELSFRQYLCMPKPLLPMFLTTITQHQQRQHYKPRNCKARFIAIAKKYGCPSLQECVSKAFCKDFQHLYTRKMLPLMFICYRCRDLQLKTEQVSDRVKTKLTHVFDSLDSCYKTSCYILQENPDQAHFS